MKRTIACLAMGVFLLCGPRAAADVIEALPGKSLPAAAATKSARGIEVEEKVRNDASAFMVRVDVDRPDRTYEEGDLMQVSVESEKDGYLYLLYKQADGTEKCLFPNKYDRNNRIFSGRKITIPTTTSRFNLRITPPLGDELLIALVTLQPLPETAFGGQSLTKSIVTDVDLDTLIAKGVEVQLRRKPDRWAEHSVKVRAVPRGGRGLAAPVQKRIGLFVGISNYRDRRVPDLHICHQDAVAMANAMQEYCDLDGIAVLIDEKATRKAIETAFRELKLKSNPGDIIFIYWSGHGASCADTGGDEADGRDEYLVPYDGNPEDAAGTMVLDDALGRWVQALDGRKVTVILDACHSGGQATGKGVDDADRGIKGFGTVPTPLDMLDSELGRIKDIGQHDASMLFSSASDEISAERRDEKLSVMTYFLVEKITESSSLTLSGAYEHVKVEVPKYMKKYYPGRTQTPQLCPADGGQDVKLR